jgi:hypothetical protein
VSKEQSELEKARALVSEVVPQDKEPVANSIPNDTGDLDQRFALWRSFCAEHGVPVETLPGDLAEPLRERWEDLKDAQIHGPEEGRQD